MIRRRLSGSVASEAPPGQPINWCWVPIDRQVLASLTRRSNLLGALQSGGFLAVLGSTAVTVCYSAAHWNWDLTIVLLLIHGTCWAFLSNAFHEFSHGTVFTSPSVNRLFLGLVSFLSWNNPMLFWASHTEHHKFTLYEGDDLEVSSGARPTLTGYLMLAFVNPVGFVSTLRMMFRHARGRIEGPWEEHLFPRSAAERRHRLSRWASALLVGHAALVLLAVYLRLWMLPVVITLAPYYGRGLQWLCNESQHTGLPGNVPDFRLCSRTVHLNPALQFLYWHMNYHTDHHLFAAVPCYRLGRLHREIEHALPPCPRGLLATWLQIAATLRRRKRDPSYVFQPKLPPVSAHSAKRRAPG